MPIPKTQTGEMPFLDHLEELRWRIIYSLGALVVGVAIGFLVTFKFDLIGLMQAPVLPYLRGQHLVYTHPGDTFSTILQMSLVVGIALALPVIGYNVWAFLSPALYRNERRIVIPILAAATFLFLAGVALAYFLVLPLTLKFLFGLEAESLTPMITVSEYFGFVTSMCLAFGGVFEVPIVIVGLSAMGIVSPQTLGKFRRYAVVIAYGAAAIITPGDLLTTTIALAIPLYLLYEVSVAVSYIIYRKKVRRDAKLASEQGLPA
ncbi:MAG TPA: twin-arginine translocase subunit TatC [Gemmatimonadaceae bacterium]